MRQYIKEHLRGDQSNYHMILSYLERQIQELQELRDILLSSEDTKEALKKLNK